MHYLEKRNHNISKQRLRSITFLKGIAICMVLFVHSTQRIVGISDVIIIPSEYGQMGCQLFFVVSALTIAISWYSKSSLELNKKSLMEFYKRRISAIILPVWTAIIIWTLFYILKDILTHTPIKDNYILAIICNALLINGLTPFANNWLYPGAWFIGTIALFYFFAPFIFTLIKKMNSKTLITTTAVYSILWYLIICFISKVNGIEIDNNSFIYFNILNQFPVLLSGIILYRKWIEDKFTNYNISVVYFLIYLFIDIILFYFPIIPNRFALVPTISGISFYYLVIYIEINYERISKPFKQIFLAFGKRSLSLMIVHSFFVWYFLIALQKLIGTVIEIPGTIIYLCFIVPAYLLSYWFAGIFDKCVRIEKSIFEQSV